MACMEHSCRSCDAIWFTNDGGGACPMCGSLDFHSTFDEDPRYYYDDDEGDEPWDGEDV